MRRRYVRFSHPVRVLPREKMPLSIAQVENPAAVALELDPTGSLLLMPTALTLSHAEQLLEPLFTMDDFDAPLSADAATAYSTALVVASLLDAYRAQRELLIRLAFDPASVAAQDAACDYLANGLVGERGTVSLVRLDIRPVVEEQIDALRQAVTLRQRAQRRALNRVRAALNEPADPSTVIPFPGAEHV